MIQQDINLYRSFESPSQASAFLSWRQFLAGNFLMLLILIVIALLGFWKIHHLNIKKEKILSQLGTLEDHFAKIKSTYPANFFSKNVAQSIKQLQQNIEIQQKILNNIENKIHFSQYLIALSQIIVPNVWLTEFLITNNQEIKIKGKSTDMEHLQMFLANMVKEKLFSGYSMNINNIESTNKDSKNSDLTFELNIAKK